MARTKSGGKKRKSTPLASPSTTNNPDNGDGLDAKHSTTMTAPDAKCITVDPMDISDNEEEQTPDSPTKNVPAIKLADLLRDETVGYLENCDIDHCVPLARVRDVSEIGVIQIRQSILSKGYMQVIYISIHMSLFL